MSSPPYAFSGPQASPATCILAAMVADWVIPGTGLSYMALQGGVQFDVGLIWAGVRLAAVLAVAVFALTGPIARRIILEESPDAP